MASPPEQPVLILSGPPGAGKTTVARLLAEDVERSVQLESDRFFHFISSGYLMPWRPEAHEHNRLVMRLAANAAAGYAEAGYFTIVEGIISPAWFFEPVRDRLRSTGRRVAYAILRAPLSVCVERAGEREPGGGLIEEVIEAIWPDFEELGDLERHVIDTGDADPGVVAERVRRALRSGALDA